MSSKLLRHAVATVGRSTGVLSGKVIAALSGFGVFWIIARQYSVHTVGEYVFLQSLGNMVVMAANWGVNELIFIECSVHSEYSEYYLARSRLAKVLLGAVIGAIATLALAAFSSFSISIFLVILVTAMTDAQTISHLMILRAHEDNTADTIHLPARSLAKLGCCYLLFFAPMQLVEILALMFLSNLATLLLVARRCRQRLRTVVPKRPDQHHTIGKLLRSATPFALSGAVGTLSTQGRVAIVGMLGGSEMVAQYGVGMQFYQVINFLPSAINVTIQPRFARLYTTDRRLWRHDVTMSTMTAFAVAVCVGLGCFFVLPYVVSRFFGERYV